MGWPLGLSGSSRRLDRRYPVNFRSAGSPSKARGRASDGRDRAVYARHRRRMRDHVPAARPGDVVPRVVRRELSPARAYLPNAKAVRKGLRDVIDLTAKPLSH
jgi:hypothetical protein